MFYVVTETCRQIEDGPFETLADARIWVRENGKSTGCYHILNDVEMDEMESRLAEYNA